MISGFKKALAVVMILAALLFVCVAIDMDETGGRIFLWVLGILLGFGAWRLFQNKPARFDPALSVVASGLCVKPQPLRAALSQAAASGYISVSMLQRYAQMYYVDAQQFINALGVNDYAAANAAGGKTPVNFREEGIDGMIDHLVSIGVIRPE